MTARQAVAINPEVTGLLIEHDWLGFSRPADCINAIIQHDDFATRWEMIRLSDQKTLEIWRSDVIAAMDQPYSL